MLTLPSVEPNPPGNAQYTIPAVQFPDGTYVMDSMKIAARIEKEHPKPSLYLDDPILEDLQKIGNKIMLPLSGVWRAGVYENVIPNRSKEYFRRTREARLGKSIAQALKETGGEEAWLEALPGIKELGSLIIARGGPFVLGLTRE